MNKFVEEAPYHPGYEDAVLIPDVRPSIGVAEIEDMVKTKERHLQTASKIMEFMKGGQKW